MTDSLPSVSADGGLSAESEATTHSTTAAASPRDEAPETGDLVIDASLAELAQVHEMDLDGQIAAGEQVQRTLQARLADLGG